VSLLALCYPKFSAKDQEFIDDFRDKHDLVYRHVVGAHFTLVFPVRDVDETTFVAHVGEIAESSAVIRFVCRYAMVHNDVLSDNYYVFLVPDEGFSEIALLHDALYTKVLTSKLRLDLPFIPHIGIATMKDATRCKELADELNTAHPSFTGSIEEITVVEYDGKLVTDVRHFVLGANSR